MIVDNLALRIRQNQDGLDKHYRKHNKAVERHFKDSDNNPVRDTANQVAHVLENTSGSPQDRHLANRNFIVAILRSTEDRKFPIRVPNIQPCNADGVCEDDQDWAMALMADWRDRPVRGLPRSRCPLPRWFLVSMLVVALSAVVGVVVAMQFPDSDRRAMAEELWTNARPYLNATATACHWFASEAKEVVLEVSECSTKAYRRRTHAIRHWQ